MAKYAVGLLVIILAAAGGYYLWNRMGEASPPPGTTVVPEQVATSTYATTTFSLIYPEDFTVDGSFQYEGVPNKPIDGVKFTIPLTMATGTTLAADSYLSVESLPRAQNCTGDIYVLDSVRALELIENGVTYSAATTSGAALGNRYEEYVYALVGSEPCTAVRYFIHSTELGNHEFGAVKEFDRAALLRAFDTIRRSLRLNAGAL